MRHTLILTALVVLFASQALTAQSYKATALKTLPKGSASQTQVWAINNSGVIAGSCSQPSHLHPCIWSTNGTAQDLGLPNNVGNGISYGINNSGQVAGTISTSSNSFAFNWTQTGGLQTISGLGSAAAINDSGDIAGTAFTGSSVHGYFYNPASGLTDLGSLPGVKGGVFPSGINSAGHVVGYSGASIYLPIAFLWTNSSGISELVPGSGLNYEALAINNSEEVVGTVYNSGDGYWHAFQWSQSTGLQDLGVGEAVGIDDAGNIVGDNGTTAVIWLKGSTTPKTLDSLIGGKTPPVLYTAIALNASGQIVSSGAKTGYLLTPTTKTSLTSSPNPSNIGQAVTFTATVTSIISKPPNGEQVKFSSGTVVLGSAPLSNGVATFTTSSLIKGTNSITATYAGDPNFVGSKSAVLKQVVQ